VIDVTLQLLGYTECLVAGEYSHDGNRRRDRSDWCFDAFCSGLIIPPTHSKNAETHKSSWFLAIARW